MNFYEMVCLPVNDVAGEGMSLTVDERKTLTEFWYEICKEKNQFLMVQVGGAPLKSVIDMVGVDQMK